jgi:hypothetical protein
MNLHWFQFGDDLDEKFQLGIAGPDLPFVNAADAFREGSKGIAAAKDTSGASAESTDYKIAFGVIHQDHCGGLRFRGAQLLQNLEPLKLTILQVGADHCNVGLVVLQFLKRPGGVPWEGVNVEVVAASLQRARNQLAAHSRGLSNGYANALG